MSPCDNRGVIDEYEHRSVRQAILSVFVCVAAAAAACASGNAFECETDEECVGAGQARGICQDTGFCSFPDASCDSGQRYGEFADVLAGACVPDEDEETDSQNASTTGPVTTGISASATSSTGGSMTTPSGTSTSSTASSTAATQGPGSDSDSDESGTTNGTEPATDLVLHLDFDQDPVVDVSEFEHEIRCSGACPESTSGLQGNAGLFPGSAGLTVASHSVFDFSADFTLAFWVRAEGPQALTRGTVFGSDGVYDISLQDVDGDEPYDLVSAFGSAAAAEFDAIAAGEWYHVAVVHTPGRQVVSIDGDTAIDQGAPVPASGGAELGIGVLGGFFRVNASIDDLRLYRRALTEAEISIVRDNGVVD